MWLPKWLRRRPRPKTLKPGYYQVSFSYKSNDEEGWNRLITRRFAAEGITAEALFDMVADEFVNNTDEYPQGGVIMFDDMAVYRSENQED